LNKLKQINLIFCKKLKRFVKVVILLLTKIKKYKILYKKFANRYFKLLKIVNRIKKSNSKKLIKILYISSAFSSNILRLFNLAKLQQYSLYI